MKTFKESEYRQLTQEEIILLQQQHCHAENWSAIRVKDPFVARRFREVTFSGKVFLGCQSEPVPSGNGFREEPGIYNAAIQNCFIVDHVHISRIHGHIANYRVGDHTVIRNIDTLEMKGESSFGNGTRINVLDETGGRTIPVYEKLSAHLAYILTLYRHRPGVIRKLTAMIDDYTRQRIDKTGTVGDHVLLMHARILRNVHIGPAAVIEGAGLIEDVTIGSLPEAPVYIGPDVVIRKSIITSGATVTDGTILEHCFVGQATVLGKQYSAEHSLFFSNCAGYHGEACSVFAGPFTVSHHKSTLMIAGMFSFLNAGSGSNQSNHMYKLGPIHHGIVERGSKTTSDSYLLWPAKVGPFTLVMGRHYKNSDTSQLPFSYLIENGDESFLAPGVNLRSVGTIRDARKWPRRDKRAETGRMDFINFNLLSPFTIDKMIRGRDLLKTLQHHSGEKSDRYVYENVIITKSSLKRGIRLYNLGIIKFLGNSLISRLGNRKYASTEEIRERLIPKDERGTGPWIDMAGLIAPRNEVEKLLDSVENDEITTLEDVHREFERLHEEYYELEWIWAFNTLCREKNVKPEEITPAHLVDWIREWKESVVTLDNMLYEDARKEFALSARTGFGTDGDGWTRELDFEQVRGKFEENQQVTDIRDHIRKKSELGDNMIRNLSHLL